MAILLRFRILLLLTALVLLTFAVAHGRSRTVFSSLTVHEWGTFTSVAGTDGRSLEWSPAPVGTELPAFVEHLRNVQFKIGLRGKIRMETPVIYFYSPREERVSVSVQFRRGLITEWYPSASHIEPARQTFMISASPVDGSIAWNNVTLSPSLHTEFPEDPGTQHYFAARQTTSTPLVVQSPQGEQQEKFLFYRGVAGFDSPVRVTLEADGAARVDNLGASPVPVIIRFERSGEKLGYRIENSSQNRLEIASPELADSGNVPELSHELEGILVSQGLYQNEAHAMIETWRDSWFEEGSRLFYIVPRSFIDSVLPLSINPAPTQLTRVFVGRVDLITGRTRDAVTKAVDADDSVTLSMYGRFLEPILRTLLETETDALRIAKLNRELDKVYAQIEAARN